jgi:acyl-coenzyme A thioesterase PaaI-like protein
MAAFRPSTLPAQFAALNRYPGGRLLFSWLVGRLVPYSGSIGARVEALGQGTAVVSLRDRRAVRNHLGSVHAIALVNLAELTSGLAMLTAAGDGVRGIVTGLEIRYLKKARGPLIATSTATPPAITQPMPAQVTATIHDASGEAVAEATVQWLLAPVPGR